MRYILDKVRLRCMFKKQFLREFFEVVAVFYPGIERWIGTGPKEYRYNFKVSDSSGGSMWIGFMHNSESVHAESSSLCMEWNPSKFDLMDRVVPERFRRLVGHVARHGELVLVHVALDFRQSIENFIVDKWRKENYKLFITRLGVTHYVGSYGHGYMKVYDKGKEQGVDYPWTRVEYVVRYDCPVDSIPLQDFSSFPRVYRIRGDRVNPVVRAVIYAMREGVVCFSDLTRDWKKKVVRECDLITVKSDKVHGLVCEFVKGLQGLY